MTGYTTLDQLPVALWASRGGAGGYQIVLWNSGAEGIYGVSREEAIGRSFTELFVEPAARANAEASADAVIAGQPHRANSIALDRRPDGEERLLLTNVFRMTWEGEELHAEVAVDLTSTAVSEIDDVARAEIIGTASVGLKELLGHTRQRAVREWIGRLIGMAHETRSELTVARQSLLAIQRASENERTLTSVERALAACARGAAVVDTTLALATSIAPGESIQPRSAPFSPHDEIAELCERYSMTTERSVRYESTEKTPARILVTGAVDDWKIAVSNLLSNAIRHGAGGAVAKWFVPPPRGGKNKTKLVVAIHNQIEPSKKSTIAKSIAAGSQQASASTSQGLDTVRLLAKGSGAFFTARVDGHFVVARLEWPVAVDEAVNA